MSGEREPGAERRPDQGGPQRRGRHAAEPIAEPAEDTVFRPSSLPSAALADRHAAPIEAEGGELPRRIDRPMGAPLPVAVASAAHQEPSPEVPSEAGEPGAVVSRGPLGGLLNHLRPETAARRRTAGTWLASLSAIAVATTAAAVASVLPAPATGWTPRPSAEQLAVGLAAQASLPSVDDATVPGLSPQRIRADGSAIGARWTYLPGESPFNARLDGILQDAIARFGQSHGTLRYAPAPLASGGLADRGCVEDSTTRPAADLLGDPAHASSSGSGPKLVIACEVVAASGTFFGERLRIVSGSASSIDRDETVTVYADTATGALLDESQLLSPSAGEALWPAVIRAIRASLDATWDVDVAAPTPEEAAALSASIRGVGLTPEGRLAVRLDHPPSSEAWTSLAGSERLSGPITVEADPAEVEAALTEAARPLVAAAGGEWSGPAPVLAGYDHVNCGLVPCVALTYDDGPDANIPGILDAYNAAGASATFFFIGRFVDGKPEVVRRVAAEGFEIGNHSWSHSDLRSLSLSDVSNEIAQTNTAIANLTGHAPTSFRPPYGAYNMSIANRLGWQPLVLWDIDTRDWQDPGPQAIIDRATGSARAGSIILMHSTHQGTADASPGLIAALQDRGFQLVTVSRLYGGTLPQGIVKPSA